MILLHPVKPQKLRVKTSYISPKREIGYLLVTDGTRLFRGSRGTINHTVILYTLARCRVMNCIRSNSVGQYYAVVAQWRLKNNRNIIVPKRGNATPSSLSLSLFFHSRVISCLVSPRFTRDRGEAKCALCLEATDAASPGNRNTCGHPI